MSELSAFAVFGFNVVELPRCACGNDIVEVKIDLDVIDDQVVLVAHTTCDDEDCSYEPAFYDAGSPADSWHEAVFRCVNAWSIGRGGHKYLSFAALPDQLEDLVEVAEAQLGSLPEFRERTLAKYHARRVQ